MNKHPSPAAPDKASINARRWLRELRTWCHQKKLEREFRNSEKFQRKCEKPHYFNLAELEKQYRAGLAARLRRLK